MSARMFFILWDDMEASPTDINNISYNYKTNSQLSVNKVVA